MAVADRAAEGGIRFPRKERLALKDIIVERVTDFQDADFWENYNIIEPEQTIEHAIRRLARKLKKRQSLLFHFCDKGRTSNVRQKI